MSTIESLNFIEIIEGRHRKEWRIIGTQYTVDEIALMRDKPVDWIVANFNINHAQVYAALAYYHLHADEIDRAIEFDDKFMEQHGEPLEKLIEELKARKKSI